MAKDEIFSKLNIKDYNNELEKILARKNFQEGTKNLLLSMLYKIEIAYNDYNKVKVETNSKKEIIENTINIVKKYCDEIEIVKPTIDKKTILKDSEHIVDKETNKIIVYPNEFILLSALQQLDCNKKINIDDKYNIIKKPVEEMFNIGNEIDISEIVRDFDGWNWNGIKLSKTQNISYNLIYQIIKLLLGNNFVEALFECLNKNEDCINFIQEKLIEKYEEEFAKELYSLVYQNSILEYLKNNKLEKTKLIKHSKMLQKEIDKMEHKSEYLQDLATSKINIGKKIKKIDTLLNNEELLLEEFKKRMYNFKSSEMPINLYEYKEMLKAEREKIIIELNLYNSVMNPINYVKTKTEIKEKIKLIQEVKLDNYTEEEIEYLKIKLQKTFLNAFRKNIEYIDKKDSKEIINYIYKLRYYKLLPITKNKQIKDIAELKKDIYQTEKELITKACNLRLLRVFSENIEDTLSIYSKILESTIIDFEDINIEFIEKENIIYINIYDDDIIYSTFKYKEKDKEIEESLKKLKMKFKKKIKIII